MSELTDRLRDLAPTVLSPALREAADLLDQYDALRPKCPTCKGEEVQMLGQDHGGRVVTLGAHCPDCTDGFMPLDAWVGKLLDALMIAFGVIANVSEGDWTQQSAEWQDAADRYRDTFHAVLALAGEANR